MRRIVKATAMKSDLGIVLLTRAPSGGALRWSRMIPDALSVSGWRLAETASTGRAALVLDR
jgi:hypothetical protein